MTDLKKLYQSELPTRAIAVYLYLRGRANKEGVCWPAIPTMARELKMSESTIINIPRRSRGFFIDGQSPMILATRHVTLVRPDIRVLSLSATRKRVF